MPGDDAAGPAPLPLAIGDSIRVANPYGWTGRASEATSVAANSVGVWSPGAEWADQVRKSATVMTTLPRLCPRST